MANTKISGLPVGAPALATDQIPVARSGTNVSLQVSDIVSVGQVVTVFPISDNVTDQSAVIQAAITALSAVRGGKVIISPVGNAAGSSVFMASSLTISSPDITIEGQAWSNQAGTPKGTVLLFAANIPGVIVSLSGAAACVTLRDLNIKSTDAQGAVSGDYGIHCGSSSLNLQNVSVRGFGDHGIFLDSSAGNCNHWNFNNVFMYQNAGDGFRISGGTDGNVGVGINCMASFNTGWGFNLVSGATNNYFLTPSAVTNTAGGYQVATVSNFFEDVYAESGTGSSFVLTAAGNQNTIRFAQVGQATTITDGGTGNTIRSFSANLPVQNRLSVTGTTALATTNISKTATTGLNAMGNVTGATTVDLSLGNVISMTLTSNITITLSNAVASVGQEVTFIITQDGTGGRVITWPTVVPAGVAPYASIAASAVSVFKAIVDASGLLNFSANGPVVVFRQRQSGIQTALTSSNTVFTPAAIGNYRLLATITCTATQAASTSTMSVNTNTNAATNSGTASKTPGVTTLALQASMTQAFFAFNANSSSNAGWVTAFTAGNGIGTGSYTVDFVVEYLGN